MEPLESRLLLSITELTWHGSNSSSAPVITNINPGQSAYVKAIGDPGTYTITIYEEEDFFPPDATDDQITTRQITVGTSGYGFSSGWTVSPSPDDQTSPWQTFYSWWDRPFSSANVESARLKLNPDLQVIDMQMNGTSMPSSVSSAPSVHVGQNVRLDFLGKNAGPGSAPVNTRIEWYYGTSSGSMSNPIDYGLLGTVNGLAPGEVEWETDLSWTIPNRTPGTYWLTAKVDPINTVPETNNDNNFLSRPFKIINDPPTDISLSNNSVPENQPSNTIVGSFSTTDPNLPNDSHAYSLVSGTGSTDNSSFTISGNQLRTGTSFNYEAKNSYSIRVRTTDAGGLPYEEPFTINVTNVNEAPTNITLSNNSVPENQPVGTTVGTFSTTDPDAGNTFTYALVSGTGSTDNGSFTINGNQLRTAASFNYEAKKSYGILVRSTDQGNLPFEKQFTINVTNVNEAPTQPGMPSASEITSTSARISWTGSSDPEGDAITYEIQYQKDDLNPFWSPSFTTQNSFYFLTGLEPDKSYHVRVKARDDNGGDSGWATKNNLYRTLTGLSWRSGNQTSSPVIANIAAGQTAYLRVDAPGMHNQVLEVEIWERDIGLTNLDDKITVKTVTINNGVGFASWMASWQGDDGATPLNRYYIYYRTDDRYSARDGDLTVSVGTSGGNLVVNPINYDWDGRDPEREPSGFFDGVIDVEIKRVGSGAAITSTLPTWVVIHGRSDSSTNMQMAALAEEVNLTTGSMQVLTLDWDDGARKTSVDDFSGETWIEPVAQWAASVLSSLGFSTLNVNLIGHSWGAVVSAELAGYFGQVNRIVALDPAEDFWQAGDGALYDPDDVDFSANSNHSWAFLTSQFGSGESAPRAHDSILVDIQGDNWTLPDSHSHAKDLFTEMLDRIATNTAGPVSALFNLDRINVQSRVWDLDQIHVNELFGTWDYVTNPKQYEGALKFSQAGGVLTPLSLEYVNIAGQHIEVFEDTLPVLSGDYNFNGVVDAADYVIWRKMLGSGVPNYSGADGDGDGAVDPDDHGVWSANFGNTLGSGSGAVVMTLAAMGTSAEVSLAASFEPTPSEEREATAAGPLVIVGDSHPDTFARSSNRSRTHFAHERFAASALVARHEALLLASLEAHNQKDRGEAELAAPPHIIGDAADDSDDTLLDAIDQAFDFLGAINSYAG